jgi:hypothetical protein
MATITAQTGALTFGSEVYTWPAMIVTDVGAGVGSPGSGDRTVQVVGTFGVGTTVDIEGTIDMINWHVLRDPAGTLLRFSGAGLKTILENVLALRPNVSAGDGTENVTVSIMVRQPRNG